MGASGGNAGNVRTKRRGVRASRLKLAHALAESGLPKKTQAALADRIADMEGLDAAPKDLVSKVFREQPVDLLTLERIARALGVEAETLYLQEQADNVRPPGETSSKRRYRTILAVAALALIAMLGATLFGVAPSDLACAVRERVTPLQAPPDKLAIIVARFDGDDSNMAQQFLASSLMSDRNLAPYISVLLTCRRPALSETGDLRGQLMAIRESAQRQLSNAGAQLMVWGKVRDGRILARFVSTRRDISPIAVELSGRPLRLDESNLELTINPVNSVGGLADMKRLALELMKTEDAELAGLRAEARSAYAFSIDWLRTSIVGQRNLRRRIDPSLDPRRWAGVNAKLCYEHRLLGDYESDETQYREALEACDETLRVRPRERFPRDWAATQINKASALVRLHYYAPDRDGAIRHLRDAERALLAAAKTLDRDRDAQLWAVLQRNLGTAYLRLGEVMEGDESKGYFDQGIDRLKTSLAMQDPAFQPLDWAITQQNLCLALYQHGARLGDGGITYVREARERCALALDKISRDDSALNWAMVQNNLAVATAILARLRDSPDDLANAISAFRQAQTVYTRDRLPGNWAEVEINLGELHCNLALLARDPAYLDAAAAHSEAALEVFIDKRNRRYQRYAEGLIDAISACSSDLAACTCSH